MVDWNSAPKDAQYCCKGDWYKKDHGGYWFVYWPNRGWESVGYTSPENFSWWGEAVSRPHGEIK